MCESSACVILPRLTGSAFFPHIHQAALVTEFLRGHELAPESFPLRQWYERQPDLPPLPRVPGLRRAQAVCPSEAELRVNSRSRSAVLHILHKVGQLLVSERSAAHPA